MTDSESLHMSYYLSIHVQWSLYFKTAHGAKKMWSYIAGGLKIKVLQHTKWHYGIKSSCLIINGGHKIEGYKIEGLLYIVMWIRSSFLWGKKAVACVSLFIRFVLFRDKYMYSVTASESGPLPTNCISNVFVKEVVNKYILLKKYISNIE